MSQTILPRRSQVPCFFDPHRACGSHSRTKLAYQRHTLQQLAKNCNIPNSKKLSLDALCELLHAKYLEQKLGIEFVKMFNKETFIPIPLEFGSFGGTLTPSNAVALSTHPASMEKLKMRILDKNRSGDPTEREKANIAAAIFFPDESLQTEPLDEYVKKSIASFRKRMQQL